MTTREKEKIVVNFNGQEMEIERDGRLHKQIQNLVEKTKEDAFKDQREMFLEAVLPGLLEQMNGFEEVLDGQSLIFDFSKEVPILHRTELIKLGQRLGKKSD